MSGCFINMQECCFRDCSSLLFAFGDTVWPLKLIPKVTMKALYVTWLFLACGTMGTQ